MLKTSGLLFKINDDESSKIGYKDYNIEFFDGADYEVMYYLDKNNFDLLLDALAYLKKIRLKNI